MFQHQVILPKYQIFERIISTYALRMIVKKPDMIIDIIDLKWFKQNSNTCFQNRNFFNASLPPQQPLSA